MTPTPAVRLICLLPLFFTACSSGGGGGGGGLAPTKSASAPDSLCNAQLYVSGCLANGNQIMTCDAGTKQWKSGQVCPANTFCVEQIPPGQQVWAASCVSVGGGAGTDSGNTATDGGGTTTDAISSGDTGPVSDAGIAADVGVKDAGTSDTGAVGTPDTTGPDTASPDTTGPDTASPDTTSPDTTGQDAGPTDPIIEPNVAQPAVGSTVPVPSITCPSDGNKKTSEANGYKVVYHTKNTPNGEVLHGSYESADTSGNIRVKACYSNGKGAGTYTGWWGDGTKRIVMHYNINGDVQGPYEAWDEKGNTVAKGIYKDNKAYGAYQRWYDGGSQLERKLYFNPPGQLRGVQKAWHENGKESYRSYYDTKGNQTGTTRSWDESGQKTFQGNYTDDLSHGTHFWWLSNGGLAGKVVYQMGTGSFSLVNDKGAVSEKGTYKDGKRQGLWQTWASNGTKVFEATYSNNVGPVTWWFSSGQKGLVSTHDADLNYHGDYAEWASDGVQTWSGKMDHGSRTGTWKYSPQSGQVISLCYSKTAGLVIYEACPSGLVVD
ncbi:MAG: hypothetical protein KC502_04370 [Myxococcales bacterium]|nr:hypothetical protein [Myxococcales bacterium]